MQRASENNWHRKPGSTFIWSSVSLADFRPRCSWISSSTRQIFSAYHYCTAKTKCRKFKTNIPRNISPNFHIHVSVSELYIPTMGLPVLLEEICRLILGIYKWLKDTWMWKLGLRPRYSQKRNMWTELPLQCSVSCAGGPDWARG